MNLTVQGSYHLADPIWGGIYQYSTKSDWKHPHYEKLLHIQARYMRIYLNDFTYTNKENSLALAQEIKKYCDRFLKQKNGLYANAQDADLIKGKKAISYFSLNNEKRLKLGIPAIDTNTYTNSNADFARALLKLYALNNQKEDSLQYHLMLSQLLKRKNEKSLYQHSFSPTKIIALRDNLAMTQLLVEHVKCFPQDRKTQTLLAQLMQNIILEFKLPNGAYKGFTGDLGIAPEAVLEENISLARLFNWYAGFSGKTQFKQEAKNILKHLQKCDAQEQFFHEPGILMLMRELNEEAQSHVSVNEGKSHPLLRKAYVFAPFYSYFKVLEKGKDKAYDELFSGVSGACLFMCTSTFCTSPLRNKSEIELFYKSQNL